MFKKCFPILNIIMLFKLGQAFLDKEYYKSDPTGLKTNNMLNMPV